MKIIKSRVLKILIVTLFIGFLLGIISFLMIKNKNIKFNYINYIDLINNGNFNYTNSLIKSIFYNLRYSFFIWIFGILFIFSFMSLFLITFKGISLGFMITSIIWTFKIKGVLYALILSLNSIINITIFLLLSYYSINFSIKSLNAYRNNRQINYKSFFINYIYIYVILSFSLILSSLFEIYICSNIIKFVV